MKIAILNNLYFPFNRGGAEQVVKSMINEFIKNNDTVFLITSKPVKSIKTAPQDSNGSTPFKIYYINSLFYNLADISYVLRFCWHIYNILSFKQYFLIDKILKEEKPDLVITHNLMGLGFLTPLAIRKNKIEHIHILHDIQLLHPSGLIILGQEKKLKSMASKFYQLLTRKLFASPNQVQSPSNWLLNEHLKYSFFKKSELIVEPFSQAESPLLNDKKKIENNRNNSLKKVKTFLFVGQIEIHKGIIFLIDAFKKIEDKNIRLIITGDGREINTAKELAFSDERFEFKGKLDSNAVSQLMFESDYLIVPSLCYENSPTVIYEARAAGLKIIASRIGGIPEIIGPNDYLFEAGNETSLISAIKNT